MRIVVTIVDDAKGTVEKLSKEYKDHEEADKEEFSRVKAIIHEMILKLFQRRS